MAGLSDQKKKLRRDRVFRAALELFDRQGFAATTMKEIALRSDLAVGTLYNYFPSKNALLMGFLERKIEEMRSSNRRDIVKAFRAQTDAKAIMESIFRLVYRGFLLFSRRTWVEILHAFFSADQDLQAGIRLDMEGIDMLERIIRLMQRRGLIQARFPARAVAFNLYSVMVVQFMLYIFVPGATEEDLHQGVSAQLDLVFAAVGAEASAREERKAPGQGGGR